ncbi:hypothetical protein EDD85DRAFT_508889 [Armillaria nabsnona]|nr:hypothetical protein EDD85DRAFT_508889 [Armillaria nabsnona]
MLLSLTALILKTIIVAWFSASVSELLPTTDISWRWLDAVMTDVGLLEPNPTSTEISDVFIQGVAIVAEPSASQPINLVTVQTADSPANEADDMDVHAEDTPPHGIIRQLLEPSLAVVEVTPAATTSVDDACFCSSPADVVSCQSHPSRLLPLVVFLRWFNCTGIALHHRPRRLGRCCYRFLRPECFPFRRLGQSPHSRRRSLRPLRNGHILCHRFPRLKHSGFGRPN